MKWISFKNKVFMASVLIGMSILLVNCGALNKKPKIPSQVESGPKGVSPSIQHDYDWVCGDRNKYRLELK